jgi:hypothetical protein
MKDGTVGWCVLVCVWLVLIQRGNARQWQARKGKVMNHARNSDHNTN